MDLLLQSWGDKIRVFPAVPASWQDASFRDLRAVGGFIVSSAQENGVTRWVSIRSESGEPCVLKVPDWKGPVEIRADRTMEVSPAAPGEYRIDLRKGEEALIFPKGTNPEPAVKEPAGSDDKANPFGVKRGKEIKGDQFWPEPPVDFAE